MIVAIISEQHGHWLVLVKAAIREHPSTSECLTDSLTCSQLIEDSRL